VRAALASLSVLGAVVAIVLGAWRAWPGLAGLRMHLTPVQAARAPAVANGLPIAIFDRWKSELRPGERWWLDVPPGPPEGMTDRGAVYRTFALYWFLPNLPASSERDANVVFRLRKLQ